MSAPRQHAAPGGVQHDTLRSARAQQDAAKPGDNLKHIPDCAFGE